MRFFVYGSLKPGHERWPALEPHAIKIERAYALGTLYDLGAYPGAAFNYNVETYIPGYLIETAYDPKIRASIDAIEGHPHLFCRRNIGVLVNDWQHGMIYGYEFVNAVHLKEEAKIHEWHPDKDAVVTS